MLPNDLARITDLNCADWWQDDFMVPTVNSFYTAQRIPNAKLIVYPNSGHGFLFQYAEEFSADVERFLA